MNKEYSVIELDEIANALKVLGHPLRLKVLLAIYTKKCRVTGLVECLEEPQPIISQQLAILRKANIINGIKEKNCIIYNIINENAKNIIHNIAKKNDLLCSELKVECQDED